MVSIRLLKLPLFLFAIFECATGFLCLADPPVFQKGPDGFRIGMEIELLPEAFAGLTHYFDFNRLQADRAAHGTQGIPDSLFDDYLKDAPRALSDLPEDLRAKLTEGLQLENLVTPKTQSLLGADGKALQNESKIILSSKEPVPPPPQATRALILPKDANPPPVSFQRDGALEVPKRVAWQTLYARWNALDTKTKRAAVKWENLSALKKAELAIQYEVHGVSLQLKKDLLAADVTLFNKLHWSRDGDALEFRHREDVIVTDPNEFYQDVVGVARRAGVLVERRILNPESSLRKVSTFHYHVSIKGKTLIPVGEALNRLTMIRRVHAGILNDLTREGKYIYSESLRSKGLLRSHGENRLEFRAHQSKLEEELKFNIRVLGLDQKEALKIVHDEISGLMSDYVVDKIAEIQSSYLPDFFENMTEVQRFRHQAKIEFGNYIKNLSKKLPADFWVRAPALMASSEEVVLTAVADALGNQETWPKEFWAQVPGMLTSRNPHVQAVIQDALIGRSVPKEIWTQIPHLMTHSDPRVQLATAKFLFHASALPVEVWAQIPTLMASPDPQVQMEIFSVLELRDNWPEAVWAHIPTLLKNSNSRVQQAIIRALGMQSVWPEAVSREVYALKASSDLYLRYAVEETTRHRSPPPGSGGCLGRVFSGLNH